MMHPEEFNNWKRIKEYFEALPDFKRDNMFYKRAVAITSGKDDPMPSPPALKEEEKEDS